MAKYLKVTVDTNDGDYAYSFNKITDKQLTTLKPLFAAIKENKDGYNFPLFDDYDGKQVKKQYADHKKALELFMDEFLPSSEYGCHTVVAVEVLEVESIKNLI